MPIGSGFEQPLERESFSRWLLKPLDIKMRQHILSAMVSLRRAELITGVLNPKKVEIDLPIEQIVSPAVDNPWDTMFEHTRNLQKMRKVSISAE